MSDDRIARCLVGIRAAETLAATSTGEKSYYERRVRHWQAELDKARAEAASPEGQPS